jgi:hypothetical protein
MKTSTPTSQPTISIHFSSRSEEWYTPSEVIDRVIATLGTIDLDPCSNSRSRPVVPARNHFTKRDDGLSRQWFGRVFMNPPYGRDVKRWVAHLCAEHKCGRVTAAIALLHARTDTAWFSLFRDYTLCFVRGRLKFAGQGAGNSAPFPSVLAYLGPQPAAFASAFADIGTIYRQAAFGVAA